MTQNIAITDDHDSPSSRPVLIIRPPKKWIPVDFHELWNYRELLATFTMRDIKIRYKQTGLGIAWAILQPLLMMLILTAIFGGLAHIPSDGVPYPLFIFSGLLPWILFAEGMTRSTKSMVENSPIMTKVYFPRLITPLAGILSPLCDFAVSIIILAVMMALYGFVPTINIIFLPLFILLAIATSMGVGLWLSALNVKYRDFQYIVPFMIQLGFYASPVVYPASMFPKSLAFLLGLNPMAGVIEGFRWALLGTAIPSGLIFVSVGIVIVILVSGMYYFRRMEQYYADIV
jgi:lipopolysaccharide transport system permease protein